MGSLNNSTKYYLFDAQPHRFSDPLPNNLYLDLSTCFLVLTTRPGDKYVCASWNAR